MAGDDAAAGSMSSSSSSSNGAPMADMAIDNDCPPNSLFQCCVCLDLLYKPIVLACGHVSCFWCVHKAMHGLRISHCAMCRQPYHHFPSICQLLHHLVQKSAPVAYKRREMEVLEEERCNDVYSPQFVDNLTSMRVYSNPEKSINLEKSIKLAECAEDSRKKASKESISQENGLKNGMCEQVSVDDLLCVLCEELLFQPVVLNCGHVYCEACLRGQTSRPLECLVCQSPHPEEFPNICLDLDHFLEEQFPVEYAMRREKLQLEKMYRERKGSSTTETAGSSQTEKKSANTLGLDEDLSNVHVGVGCDSCGMYPIIGKRYKCKDCKEAIGFDLCEACYSTTSKLPGRFNQQHQPDHKFELDDSAQLCKILRFRSLPQESHQEFPELYISLRDLEDNEPGFVDDYGDAAQPHGDQE